MRLKILLPVGAVVAVATCMDTSQRELPLAPTTSINVNDGGRELVADCFVSARKAGWRWQYAYSKLHLVFPQEQAATASPAQPVRVRYIAI